VIRIRLRPEAMRQADDTPMRIVGIAPPLRDERWTARP
jgi:hypothetical protein